MSFRMSIFTANPLNMNQLKLLTLGILLATSIVSCKKNKPPQILKYEGVATTYKQEIWRGNDTSYHLTAHDTLDFGLTVIIEGKSIQFLSANDTIIESATFKISDSVFNDNTYVLRPRSSTDPIRGERIYKMKADSLIYAYKYNRSGNSTLYVYEVKFTGSKR